MSKDKLSSRNIFQVSGIFFCFSTMCSLISKALELDNVTTISRNFSSILMKKALKYKIRAYQISVVL